MQLLKSNKQYRVNKTITKRRTSGRCYFAATTADDVIHVHTKFFKLKIAETILVWVLKILTLYNMRRWCTEKEHHQNAIFSPILLSAGLVKDNWTGGARRQQHYVEEIRAMISANCYRNFWILDQKIRHLPTRLQLVNCYCSKHWY